MKTRWTLIGAAILVSGAALTTPAAAEHRSNVYFGTNFSNGGHHGRHFDNDRFDNRRFDRNDRYRHGRHDHHQSRSSISFGFSTIIGASPYYSTPYYGYGGYPYNSGYGYNSWGYAPRTVVVPQPVYVPQAPTYTAQPYGGDTYQQSRYLAPVSASQGSAACLQEREYQTTIEIGGRQVPAYGTACLQPDGSWAQGPAQPEQ